MNAPLRARGITSNQQLRLPDRSNCNLFFLPSDFSYADEHPPVRPQCCRRCLVGTNVGSGLVEDEWPGSEVVDQSAAPVASRISTASPRPCDGGGTWVNGRELDGNRQPHGEPVVGYKPNASTIEHRQRTLSHRKSISSGSPSKASSLRSLLGSS